MVGPGDETIDKLFQLDPQGLANKIKPFLGAFEFQRRFRPKILQLSGGFAPGYPNFCEIVSGSATYRDFNWSCNFELPLINEKMDFMRSSMSGFVSHLSGGKISKTESGVLVATRWCMQSDRMSGFAQNVGLMESIDFISQGEELSCQQSNPTFFDSNLNLKISQGDQIIESPFSPIIIADADMQMSVSLRAKGHIDGAWLRGNFYSEYHFKFPALPMLDLYAEGSGDFAIQIDL
jgi:hypothetical protein